MIAVLTDEGRERDPRWSGRVELGRDGAPPLRGRPGALRHVVPSHVDLLCKIQSD